MQNKYPGIFMKPVRGGFIMYIMNEEFVYTTKERAGDAARAFLLNPKRFFEDHGLIYAFPMNALVGMAAQNQALAPSANLITDQTKVKVPVPTNKRRVLTRANATKATAAMPATAPPAATQEEATQEAAEASNTQGAGTGDSNGGEWN